ncbi:spectrin repeat domain-containing protein [Phthorimaea operculella]|nr:spectrin repeat domain-containing protein [Phthorimaea operculella]
MVEDRGKDEISAQNLMKKHEILEQAVDDYAQTIRQLGETVRQLTSEEHPLRKLYLLLCNTLYMMVEDRGKDEISAQNLMKKHEILEQAVDDYAQTIRQLGETVRQLTSEEHPLRKKSCHEAKAWMSEQELYMMVEDRGKDEISAQNLMKKHEILEQAVDDYAQTIRQLGETVRQLTSEEHPLSWHGNDPSVKTRRLMSPERNMWQIGDENRKLLIEQISVKQSQVDKLYAGLKDLAGERRAKLDEALRLFQLSREVDDLEQWITERELVASSQELGQDYEHVTLLWERFKEFARETQAVGSERVATAERIADQMIAMGHSDNATIAQWKEGLKETWQDLLELIETRTQMLAASRELHKYFHDCKDTLQRVNEKARGVSDELGRDAISVGALQRKHHNFMQDLSTLQQQVEAISAECGRLGASYAGDKAAEITRREAEVAEAWAALQAACAARKAKLEDADDLYRFLNQVRNLTLWMDDVVRQMNTGEKPRFLNQVRNLTLWMDDVVRQMNTGEKPRDVSGVELLMNNHQSLKAEIDTREDNFSQCISLGKELLSRSHYASNDIKEKLLQLTNQRNALLRRWEERWENLQLREAAAADQPEERAAPTLGGALGEPAAQGTRCSDAGRSAGRTCSSVSTCISLGKELLSRSHYSNDIKEKLLQLTNQRNALLRRWEERWENLQLILEVYQFARDAAVAEAWLIAQEPYLLSSELGHTIDEVESLIKKHEAFEKSAAAQEDRFSALQRLTTSLYNTIDEVESLIKKHEAFEKSAAAQEDRFSALQRLTTSLYNTIDEVESLIKKHEAFEKSAAAQEDRFSALQRLTTLEREGLRPAQPWVLCDDNSFTYLPPKKPTKPPIEPLIIQRNNPPVAKVVEYIVKNSGKFNIKEKYKQKSLSELNKNDSYLWSVVGNEELSTISEISTPPTSPLQKSPFSPDIYSSVFFEYNTKETEKPNVYLACIDFILWERLSNFQVYPNVTLLRQNSSSSSKTNSIKRVLKRLSIRKKSNDSDTKSDVAVLSLPGLTSSSKCINDLGKEVKSVPLNSSLLLLSQTRGLLPDGAWYYDYVEGFEVKEMKRRQEAAEAAEREAREREASAAAAAAAAAAHDAVDRAASPEQQQVVRRTSTKAAEKAQERPHSQPAPGSSSTPATPSTGGKVKTRSRSKSPFHSFRWKAAKKLIAGGHHSDDEEGASPAGDDEGVEGTLTRKHEWESAAKRASNRSWDKVYVVAKDGRMSFYKDQKSYKSAPDAYFKGEPPLDLNGAVVEVAANYTKKKHVFRVRLASGAEFLFQAHDDSEMGSWLESLRARTAAPAPRSHTLPAPANTEPKRRSFFTLKKN